jgi:hypothetical protein
MNAKRLKYNELKSYRESELAKNDVCPLCLDTIPLEASALDHCHVSGRVRRVLHPECNLLLGKIENYLKRWSRGLNDAARLSNFLGNAYAYMVASYASNPLHPKHMTPEEKEIKRLTKIMNRSKKPATKAKYKLLIHNKRRMM